MLFQRQWQCYIGWEGNHRFRLALAMCHRLFDISTYRLSGHRMGYELPADAVIRVWLPFNFFYNTM